MILRRFLILVDLGGMKMKEMTNLDIIFEMYEKPYIKKEEEEKSSYHEITNFDIILYVSKKLEERTKKDEKRQKKINLMR